MKGQEGHLALTCENMVIVDADFADKVAFDLIVNFERMLGRRIPQADTARWIDCLALDGGIREGKQQTQVVFVHSRGISRMENFTPGSFADDLNGKAFSDQLGEFVLTAVSDEDIVSKEDLLLHILELSNQAKDVKRVVVVPNDNYYDRVREVLRRSDDEKRITVLAMQPMPGGNFRQEILGYSLMSALGIRSEELSGR
jgi:hypothetical protein